MITLDLKGRRVLVDGEDAGLTRTELRVVEILAEGRRLVDRELFERLHPEEVCGVAAVNARWHVQHIRQKGVPIDMRRGLGYMLGDTVEIIE